MTALNVNVALLSEHAPVDLVWPGHPYPLLGERIMHGGKVWTVDKITHIASDVNPDVDDPDRLAVGSVHVVIECLPGPGR